MFNSIDEAVNDLKQGKIIIVCDDENRENEGDFIALAEKATPEVVNFMVTHGKGLMCVPIEEDLAQKFELAPMVANNTDTNKTAFTISIDHKNTTTGISAFERSLTVLSLVDPDALADDFKRPGHVFPLIAKKGGVCERPGHTEAAVDLAKLSDSVPAGVICEIMNEDGTMARVPELRKLADHFGLKMISIKALIQYLSKEKVYIQK